MATDHLPSHCWRLSGVLLVVVAAVACGGAQPPPNDPAVLDANDRGSTVAPTSDAERQLLAQLGDLPAGKKQQIGSLTVVANKPYHAASGRTCRSVDVTSATSKGATGARLACTEGGEWFFVPNVFVAPTADP